MKNNKYETPYDKFQTRGPSALSDAELLAIILRNGNRNEDAYSLALRILNMSDYEGKIIGLQNLSFEELLEIEGIGMVKAMCIGCIIELSRRMYMQSKRKYLNLKSPDSVAEYFMEEVRHLEVENVLLLLVDVKCNLIKTEFLTKGCVNSSLIPVREIFISALKNKASGIILIHNHPSGDPTPSDSDIDVSLKIRDAGLLMDIPLFDHIIIGDRRFVSLRQNGCF